MKKTILLIVLVYSFGFSLTSCFGAPVATLSSYGWNAHGYVQTVGWEFTVKNTISVTDLYWFDPLKDQRDYQVAIWDSNGTVVASAGHVGNYGINAYDGYYWDTPIIPVTLTPGNYVIGGLINPNDFIASNMNGNLIFSYVDPNITYLQAAASIGASLVKPGFGQGYTGYFGPNFGIQTSVPEPATMLLFGLGIAGLAGVRRFKK